MPSAHPTPRCFLIAYPSGDRSGNQYFDALCRQLARQGHRVVAIRDQHRYDLFQPAANPATYIWPSPRPVRLRDALFLYRLIRQYQPVCLLSTFGAVNVMSIVGWFTHIPFRVGWYRTLSAQIELDRPKPRWIVRLLRYRKRVIYQLLTHLVANSSETANDLSCVFRIPRSRIRVFYMAIHDPVEQYGISLGQPRATRIVSVGRLEPSKGQDILIRALALLKEDYPLLQVEFIGQGATKENYLQLAHELGVYTQCRFIGSLPPEQVFQKLSEAVLTVVSSRSEAFGMVNVESLAVGTPVIASNVGGISEVIEDGVNGFLIPPDQPAILAARIRMLLEMPGLLDTMRLNARSSFLERFDLKKASDELARWLVQMTTNSSPEVVES